MNDVGKRAHVLKHSHRRCVIGAFDKHLHEGYIWTGPRSAISFILHKSIFLHFVHHDTNFYEKIYNLLTEGNILMLMGVVFFQKKKA